MQDSNLVFMRILHKLNDPITIERLCHLNNLILIIMPNVCQEKHLPLLKEMYICLSYMLFHSQVPSITKSTLKVIRSLPLTFVVEGNNQKSVFDLKYFIKSFTGGPDTKTLSSAAKTDYINMVSSKIMTYEMKDLQAGYFNSQ
jgi:hypothetical protein